VPQYDPAAARALLREAGFPDGFDTALWVRTDDALLRLAQSYQQDLAEVGIRARIRNLSWASFLELIRRPGAVPLYMLGWEADFPDASNYLEVLLHSRNIGSNNHSFFADAEFDRLVDQAAVTPDPVARLELLRRAERHVLPLAPLAPLYYPVEVQAVAPRVRNYRLNPLRPPRFERVEVVG
jgi:ABC-type transport system substrate-binding protein